MARENREELARLIEYYREILGAVGEGLLCLTAGGDVSFANPAANKMLGHEDVERAGSFCEVVHCKRGMGVFQKGQRSSREPAGKGWICPPESCPIQKTILDGKRLYVEEDVFWKTDGTPLPVAYVSSPLCRNGRTESAVIAFRDISQEKRAEEEKNRIQKELVRAQKMEAIGMLAGGVAHDFNNILTAIYGLVDLCLRDADPSSRMFKRLDYIRNTCDKASSLVKQLLMFGRKQSLDFQTLDLNGLVEELVEMLRRLIGEDVAVDMQLAPGLWPVRADASGIEQVIMNLAVNARDAMPGGGRLALRTENVLLDGEGSRFMPGARPGRFIRISVQDTGTGMAPEVMEYIFDPFFTTKEKGKGSGLGLSVVYGIVANHQGWIHVDSVLGQGTTFDIYLPATDGRRRAKGRHGDEVDVVLDDLRGSGQKVLLVEDDEEVRNVVLRLLHDNGYRVFPASSVEEARKVYAEHGGDFDLVFSDIVLPDGNGIDLAEYFMEQDPGLNVLLSSGYLDRRSQWTQMENKRVMFLQKPYSMTRLLRVVRTAMGSDS